MMAMRWMESGLKLEALEAEMTALKQEMAAKNAELDSVKKKLSIAQSQTTSLDEICMRQFLIMHSETEILINALRGLADDLDAFQPKTTHEVEEFKTSTRRMLSIALLESDAVKHKPAESPTTPVSKHGLSSIWFVFTNLLCRSHQQQIPRTRRPHQQRLTKSKNSPTLT
jgi:hypothetical protein